MSSMRRKASGVEHWQPAMPRSHLSMLQFLRWSNTASLAECHRHWRFSRSPSEAEIEGGRRTAPLGERDRFAEDWLAISYRSGPPPALPAPSSGFLAGSATFGASLSGANVARELPVISPPPTSPVSRGSLSAYAPTLGVLSRAPGPLGGDADFVSEACGVLETHRRSPTLRPHSPTQTAHRRRVEQKHQAMEHAPNCWNHTASHLPLRRPPLGRHRFPLNRHRVHQVRFPEQPPVCRGPGTNHHLGTSFSNSVEAFDPRGLLGLSSLSGDDLAPASVSSKRYLSGRPARCRCATPPTTNHRLA